MIENWLSSVRTMDVMIWPALVLCVLPYYGLTLTLLAIGWVLFANASSIKAFGF